MTVQFRSHLGAWHIASSHPQTPGQTITVTRRNGQQSNVIVGALVAHDPARDLPYLYAFTDARRASGATPEERTVLIEGVNRLFSLFENARRHNQAPAVRFALSNTTRGLRLELAPHGRYAGQLLALSEQRTGRSRRTLYGSLHTDGRFIGRVGATAIELEIFNEVSQVVRSFAADPAGFSAAHGRATGQCCYCGRGLTDERSVAVGYGPVCAEHYGLPWGDAPPPPTFDVRQGPTTQRERLADNAGTGNAFDDAEDIAAREHFERPPENMADIVRRELAQREVVDRWARQYGVSRETTVEGLPYTQNDDELRRAILAEQTRLARNPNNIPLTPPAPAAGVVTNTYRRTRPAAPRVPSAAEQELERRAFTPTPAQAMGALERARARNRAARSTEPRPALSDETVTTVHRAVRRDPNTPLEEDDFVWRG